jgi:hypothetical protein
LQENETKAAAQAKPSDATHGSSSWLWPIAIFAVVASLSSRALLPGLRGSVVGISALIDAADSALGIVAQLTAILLLSTLVWLTVQVVRARAPLFLKLLTVFFAGLAFFGTFGAMVTSRSPDFVMAVACFATCALAILMGLYAFRVPDVGFVAAAPILIGVASLVRAIGALVSDTAAELRANMDAIVGAFHFATVLATISFGLVVLALGVVVGWLLVRASQAGRVVVAVLVVLAVLGAVLAAAPADDRDWILVVVIRRGVHALLTRPAPLLPPGMPMALVLGAPLVAIATLSVRAAQPALRAAVALAVLAADAADIPILGLALGCGAVGLGAFATDPRGVARLLARADAARGEGADPRPEADAEPSLPRQPS